MSREDQKPIYVKRRASADPDDFKAFVLSIDGVQEVRRGSADADSPSRWYTVWADQAITGAVLIALTGSDMVETAEFAKKRFASKT